MSAGDALGDPSGACELPHDRIRKRRQRYLAVQMGPAGDGEPWVCRYGVGLNSNCFISIDMTSLQYEALSDSVLDVRRRTPVRVRERRRRARSCAGMVPHETPCAALIRGYPSIRFRFSADERKNYSYQ